jgi:hypothetical protein
MTEQRTYEQVVADFVRGCGLRRSELKWLCGSDFYQRYPRGLVEPNWIHIDAMNGLPAHEVPFLNEYDWTIAEICNGKDLLEEVFSVLPDLDYEALRLSYAHSLFQLRYESLGATGGPRSLHEIGQSMKSALGLTRMDAQIRAWLQWARRDLGMVI